MAAIIVPRPYTCSATILSQMAPLQLSFPFQLRKLCAKRDLQPCRDNWKEEERLLLKLEVPEQKQRNRERSHEEDKKHMDNWTYVQINSTVS